MSEKIKFKRKKRRCHLLRTKILFVPDINLDQTCRKCKT